MQNPDESSAKKYQNHVGCSYGCKLLCVYDQLCNKLFESYLCEDAGHKFISSIVKVIAYCSCVMKKHFNKNLL